MFHRVGYFISLDVLLETLKESRVPGEKSIIECSSLSFSGFDTFIARLVMVYKSWETYSYKCSIKI